MNATGTDGVLPYCEEAKYHTKREHGTVTLAKDPPATVAKASEASPLSAHSSMLYQGASSILLRAAEKMPEAHYSFKPTESVRSFGQIVGHVAESQYTFCSVVLGEKDPAPKIEKTKTSKADLVAALSEAIKYCSKAHQGMTETSRELCS